MISIFVPIRKGSKRVKNKNIKRFNKYKLGLTELKILQLKRLKEKVVKKKFFNHVLFKSFLINKETAPAYSAAKFSFKGNRIEILIFLKNFYNYFLIYNSFLIYILLCNKILSIIRNKKKFKALLAQI